MSDPSEMDAARLIFSGLICGLGLLFGGFHLLRGASRPADEIWARWDTPAGAVRRRRRRGLGAAIVVTTSAAFFVGVNFLSPRESGLGFLLFWLVVVVLILWLYGLAVADLLATRGVKRKKLASISEPWADATTPNTAHSTPQTAESPE